MGGAVDKAAEPARVTVITNGTFFSALGLAGLLAADQEDIRLQVLVTTGLRRTTGNRATEAVHLVRRWGVRYTFYKLAVYALPTAGEMAGRRALTVPTACRRAGIPYAVERNVNSPSAIEAIRAFGPDLVVSFSCPYKVGDELLEIPRVGSLNVHSSLLPAYAGICTYVHVLADGQRLTGVTVHEMVSRFDAGRIVAQAEVPIEAGTSVFALFARQCQLASDLLTEAVATCLRAGAIVGGEQDLGQRTYRKEPTRQDMARLRGRGHRLIRAREALQLVAGVPGRADQGVRRTPAPTPTRHTPGPHDEAPGTGAAAG